MRLFRIRNLLMVGVVVAALVAGSEWLSRPTCATVGADGGLISIRSDRIDRGEAKFFCYRDSAGRKLRFVLARGDDGVTRSVMDACSQCYKFRKGFTASNGYLICRLCGNRYKISDMLAGKASCVPVSIENHEHDGVVTIDPAELEKNQALF
jgi:uncharacterized membrane protein